ncbi:FkbM family methyltransferase [Methylobacterium nodulans]|uniref:Methyltransferase FkbM family n=1 Tax=Methylobacterium nodulans (strain LMG 21967 / CNCM I-2342 / ORS 2060) TaxID=460265 RepID=B8IAB7_METNO|nr:FkbM family methyltransferase [Methylobacterium nodulans]ACL59180.1 methyltransferase FkbM family [Methylobacterium nodulans ORS 2060]
MPEPIDTLDDIENFRLHVCQRLIDALNRRESGNVDKAYPPIGVTVSKSAFAETCARFLAFLTSNWEGMARTFGRLEDAASRQLLVDLLLFRALGHRRVRLASNVPAYWEARWRSEAMPAEPSEFATKPGGIHLLRFAVPGEDRTLTLDCLRANIFFTFLLRQYHFTRDGVTVRPEVGDYVVDAGACFGDTAVDFAQTVGEAGRVHCFDPVEMHLRILNRNIARNGLSNVLVFPTGLSDHDQDGSLAPDCIDPGFAGTGAVPFRSLDGLMAEGTLPRVDFIKMDIEGHELSALRGAERMIRTFRPKLAISLYHRWSDYFEIPDFIAGLDLGYRFFLHNYTISDGETVLYCAVH